MTKEAARTVALVLLVLAAGLCVPAEEKGAFGGKDPGLLNLKGTIYLLNEEVGEMPVDLGKFKTGGVIYTDRLDISQRAFEEGFPGVTDRFEWFGILYTGTFQVAKPGLYRWKLESDDGSRLWIDGKEIINNDGIHAMAPAEGECQLTRGQHAMKVWFFQGPATELGLQLWLTPPGGEEKIFSLKDFSAGLSESLGKVKAEATSEGIRVRMDAQVLFDSGKSLLKPQAKATLADVAQIIQSYPGCTVKVEGHTDSQGDEAFNQKLSEDRANSVKAGLAALDGTKDATFKTAGYGKKRPIAPNDTEAGRAQNRRVEILIVP